MTRRLLPFLIIYAVVVGVAMQPDQIQDPDLGFHLRMGEWVWAHGEVPTIRTWPRRDW